MRAFRRLATLAFVLWLLAVVVDAWLLSSLTLRTLVGDARQFAGKLDRQDAPCRTIVVGSSPGLFGLSAATLGAATGCPGVNVSLLNAGRHIDAYLDRILELTHPGDIVVVTDRRWTQFLDEDHSCEWSSPWMCFLVALKPVPYMMERARSIVPAKSRDAVGDLAVYPPMTSALRRVQAAPLADAVPRLAEMRRQRDAIQARGACAVFASPPMLVEPASLDELQSAFDARGRHIVDGVPDIVWMGPLLSVDSSLFVLEGQHASARLRDRWTAEVSRVARERCAPAGRRAAAASADAAPVAATSVSR